MKQASLLKSKNISKFSQHNCGTQHVAEWKGMFSPSPRHVLQLRVFVRSQQVYTQQTLVEGCFGRLLAGNTTLTFLRVKLRPAAEGTG